MDKPHREKDFCPGGPGGEHEADLSTVHVEYDGGQAYVDVNCRHCGRSGCIAAVKDNDPVDW